MSNRLVRWIVVVAAVVICAVALAACVAPSVGPIEDAPVAVVEREPLNLSLCPPGHIGTGTVDCITPLPGPSI
jgi:hypothetical protein